MQQNPSERGEEAKQNKTTPGFSIFFIENFCRRRLQRKETPAKLFTFNSNYPRDLIENKRSKRNDYTDSSELLVLKN